MSNYIEVQTQTLAHGVEVQVVYDPDPINPSADWDIVKISYNASSRWLLGNECADAERDAQIRALLESGEYIGMPVYAYVHSGATISTTPFGCPWDSGRSGYVYMTREASMEWAETKRVNGKVVTEHTDETLENVRRYLNGCVKEFAQWLEGEVYGFRVLVDGEEVDSCWGFISTPEECMAEGLISGEWYVEQAKKEMAEAAYWAERDVMTVGGRR